MLRIVERWGDVASMSPAEARARDDRRRLELAGVGPSVASVEDIEIAGPRGGLRVRVYRSHGDTPGVLVWLHGGGWVVGSLDGVDDQARALANASGCAVVTVDYALAPEHKYPLGLDDCFAALEWSHDHAEALGAPSGRVAIGGDSAGGNLAAAVCLIARDRGGPEVDLQLLIYPVTCRSLDTPSRKSFASGYWLTLEDVEWFWQQYLGSDEDATSAYASPLLAPSVAGLPPALVVVAECDLLRDEGVMYAQRLREAGVQVGLHEYRGMLHGFIGCGAIVDAARMALDEVGRALRQALRASTGDRHERSQQG